MKLCLIALFVIINSCVANYALNNITSYNSSSIWISKMKGHSIDCNRISWIHTAKTGSTFCLVLQHVCCPVKFEQLTEGITTEMIAQSEGNYYNRSHSAFRYISHYCYQFTREGHPPLKCIFSGRPEHIPLRDSVDLDFTMGLLMVRDPKSRVISAFLDGVHLEGLNSTYGKKLQKELQTIRLNNNISREENLLQRAQIYAYHSDLYGHQVKMLLGLPVLDLSQPNPKHIEEIVQRAAHRLRKFYFVGLFEEYARSLKLFHALANVGTVPTAVELFPQRSTAAADKKYLMQHLVYSDPYDTYLHNIAKRIFSEEVAFVQQAKNITI